MATPDMLQKDARIIGNMVPDDSRIFARQSVSSIARTSALENLLKSTARGAKITNPGTVYGES
jgi:hypothetical protein